MDSYFCKKYNNVVNKYEEVSISFIPKINKVIILQEINCNFENNDIILNKDEAIEIAVNKEKDLYQNVDNIDISCKLDIEKMNSAIYMIENNIKDNFGAKNEDNENISGNKYYAENIVRNVYNVKITNKTTNRIINYFVDATTGEIIGGEIFNF